MDKHDPEPEQTETEKLSSAPEISGGSRAVPQLIRSTKSTKVEPKQADTPSADLESDSEPDETLPMQGSEEPAEQEAETDSDIGSEEAVPPAQEAENTDQPEEPAAAPAEDPADTHHAQPWPAWRREPTEEELEALNEHWNEPGDPDGVFAAEEHEKWREEHPAAPPTPQATYKKGHPFRTTLIVLVVIVAGAAGAWWFGDHEAAKSNPPAAPQKQTVIKQATPAVTPTTQYTSTNYNIGLNYPQTWKLTDTAAKLTVASPGMQFTTAAGSKMSGHMVVTIQNQQTTVPGFPSSGAVSVLESQKLTYTQPTPEQRAQTYLSFLSYNQNNGLDALFVTGDNGYMQSQVVPLSDVVQGNPLVSVNFETCESDDCATGTPTALTLAAGSWKNTAISKPIVALLQSITLND